MLDLLHPLLNSNSFIPHGHCYLWKPGLVWLHVLSDSVIALSYFSIPCLLVYFVSKRRDIPFNWIFLMFGAFIIACGTGHLMDIWTLWYPTYWLSGVVKALTALVSMYTALELIPLIPKALALSSPAQLEAANQELEQALKQLQQAQSQLIKTEIKLAKAEILQQSEERFRSLLQNASNIIATLESSGGVVYVSPSLMHILGHQPEDWIAKNLPELVHPDDGLSASALLYRAIDNPSQKTTVEFRLHHADGSWHDFEAIAKNLLDEPNVAGIVITCRDITERKQAEAEVRKALEKERELNELKSRFISMASHEFRTPLAIVSSSIGILEDYGHRLNPDQSRKQFQHVQKSITHITQLLDDVLMINRVEGGKVEFMPTAIDVMQFCHDLVEEIQLSAPSHQITLFITDKRNAGSNSYTQLDKKLLQSILTNLLSNAVKYSFSGSAIDFNLICQNEETIFKIQDRGIGIPDDDRDHLFKPFHRAKNVGNIPGTGLGLSIVKKCIDLHGGEIKVCSQVNIGTVFTVIIPTNQMELIAGRATPSNNE
ncbi:PAS domain-containing sensor histidine kinase [Nostoc sp. DedSLP04]|uniref:sensor histidine kinase n=1 Tax=Nostoc sp. DedSLP04 TaxID=3075401 RepID=UPI002AD2DF1A|nr:PAS domain-containing sensor histidine kinase [Nostoc sp. DedSLP04]MDZ8029512.1 PAS domain-containing sensor histidine kinase [Nostoc sp. DedSLP04]